MLLPLSIALAMMLAVPLTSPMVLAQPNAIRSSVIADSVMPIDSDFTFTEDLVGTTLVVTADKVTINGNGFTLRGPSLFSAYGIVVVGHSKVTIENLRIETWYVGIQVEDSEKCKLTDNVVSDCDYGIVLYDCNKIDVKRNTVSDCSMEGIYLRSSTNSKLIDNILAANADLGIFLRFSSMNTLTGNLCYENRIGIQLMYSDSNSIIGNSCGNNEETGIFLGSSTENTVADNTCNDNKEGIALSFSTFNTLTRNTCERNEVGIQLYESDSNSVAENTCSTNTFDGILVHYSNLNTVSRNICTGNGNGIFINFGESNTADDNTCTGNVGGINLSWSKDCVLVRNTCSNNDEAGIYVAGPSDEPTYNIVTENICNENNEGIALSFSTFNTLTRNTCERNRLVGIQLYESSANLIYHNNLIDNTAQALDTDPAGNHWFDPDSSEGNYWSDYPGVDLGDDGIGDTFTPWNHDEYPFIYENGWLL